MSYDEEEDWDKIVGQAMLRVGVMLSPLRKYGQGVYVDGVMVELRHILTQTLYKGMGVDMPFNIEDIHW